MKIKTLKRMMNGRTIAQKYEVVSVSSKEGQALISKGYAVEVDAPHVEVAKVEAEKTKVSKPTEAKDKAD